MMQQPSGQQGLLQDLLPPFTETWSTYQNPQELSAIDTQLFPSQEHDLLLLPSSSSSAYMQFISSPIQPTFQSLYNDESIYCFDSFTPLNDSISPSYDHQLMVPLMAEEEEDDDDDRDGCQNAGSHDQISTIFTMGSNGEKKSNKSKKVEGQPSKNLMAERRRRKRLNDRLSMLRSIVPKISKMDRTSILGDTIDYMKELLERINNLKEQDIESDVDARFKKFNMNESQARNPPKFNVERGNTETQIHICCTTKPGLLLSTVNTLEALGVDIQECVISCFNDFFLQASCSEAVEYRSMISCEEMKQILFRNAGYGGRCL